MKSVLSTHRHRQTFKQHSNRRRLSLFVRSVALSSVLLLAGLALADVPVPERLYNPGSVEEAWNVIRLATANTERLLHERRLDEVTGQIALCSAPLRLLARHGAEQGRQQVIDESTARSFTLMNLVAKESTAGNQGGAENVFGELRKTLATLADQFDPAAVSAEIFACLAHPDSVSLQPGEKCSLCGRPLHARRVPYSFVFVTPGEPTLTADWISPGPIVEGRETVLKFRLAQKNGEPVTGDDLVATHGAPLHLILVDESLEAHEHLTPVETQEPGVYEAVFLPRSSRRYLAWVGAVPASTGLQEYVRLGPSRAEPANPRVIPETDRAEVLTARAGGLEVRLVQLGMTRISSGQTRLIRIEVSDAQGLPVSRLEPVRLAFAHLTGIYEEGETLLEAHPLGGDILGEELRGGPTLAFKLHPPKPGFLRLFCELRVDGKPVTAVLGLRVWE